MMSSTRSRSFRQPDPAFFETGASFLYDGATGASEAISGLAVTDIEVYKGTTMEHPDSNAAAAATEASAGNSIVIAGASPRSTTVPSRWGSSWPSSTPTASPRSR